MQLMVFVCLALMLSSLNPLGLTLLGISLGPVVATSSSFNPTSSSGGDEVLQRVDKFFGWLDVVPAK